MNIYRLFSGRVVCSSCFSGMPIKYKDIIILQGYFLRNYAKTEPDPDRSGFRYGSVMVDMGGIYDTEGAMKTRVNED
jgi:hypothetical protein